jgi:flagellar biosynthesis protein FlhA
VACSNPQVRPGLRHITSISLPRLAVLSLVEITRDTQVESLGQVGAEILQDLELAAV